MMINSALKLKHVAWALGALVAVILFIAVAHSSAKVSRTAFAAKLDSAVP
jgi:hypothetical protein